MISSYADPEISLSEKILFWPMHRLIRRLKGSMTDESFRKKVAEHSSTVRGIVVTARSLAEFGLTVPQKFVVPLIVVWNFTNQCNLHCRHCYQSAASRPGAHELSLSEKLRIVDELGKATFRTHGSDVTIVALAAMVPVAVEAAGRLADAGVVAFKTFLFPYMDRLDEFEGIFTTDDGALLDIFAAIASTVKSSATTPQSCSRTTRAISGEGQIATARPIDSSAIAAIGDRSLHDCTANSGAVRPKSWPI